MAMVRWDIGGLDDFDCTSQAMNTRLKESGMLEAIKQWMAINKDQISHNCFLFENNRWGKVLHVPIHLAEEVAEIVINHFEAAIINIPTEDFII